MHDIAKLILTNTIILGKIATISHMSVLSSKLKFYLD